MEPCEGGLGEGRLETGVSSELVAAGDARTEGVDAWNVASRSGVGEEVRLKKLHPKKMNAATSPKSFVLLIIPFNRLKIELFA